MGEAPSYESIAERHNQRVEQLRSFYSRGVVELEWTDEKGKDHWEQGSIDLWVDLPGCLALRIEKFGEEFVWVGADDHRTWVFDLTGDATVLHLGARRPGDWEGGAGPVALTPSALLTLTVEGSNRALREATGLRMPK